ncbi:Unknown protein [Striga hermonthica]|uniref:Replication factor A C-terminal domain-containing protein n=1 Tax=Striga hermonthica TaxID=68872 RepID=A0A9N7MLG4_STRHE|nr:Unknown protein [Striga hermonthica]
MTKTLTINQVQPRIRGWTVVIQVIERCHILVSQKDTSVSYRRFLFSDAEGTNVSAVVYNNNIRTGDNLSITYKIYRVSGATLKKVEEKYRVGQYDFSWTINNNTLIQPCDDVVPTHLYCHMDTERFANLHHYADSENLQRISLSTKSTSAILINPPTPEANELKQWLEIDNLVTAKAFTDPAALLPRPPAENIMSIETYLNLANNSLWFAACSNCQNKFHLEVGSDMRCSSCNQQSQIVARARIPIYIEDETDTIAAVVYGDDAEELAGSTGAELKDTEEEV